MQVLQVDDPFFGPGLKLMQRICYAGTLFGWFDSWRTVGYILVPPAVITTGSTLSAPLLVLLPAFVVQLAVQQCALHRLSRGMSTPFWSIVFDFSRLPATFAATFQRFFKKRLTFSVTEKGASAEGRRRVQVPGLLFWLALASAAVLAWGLVNLLLPNAPFTYASKEIVWGAMFWATFNGVFLERCWRWRYSTTTARNRGRDAPLQSGQAGNSAAGQYPLSSRSGSRSSRHLLT